jgi:hypothetical protein
MEKSKILANVVSLTADQLFEEIKQGNITLEELKGEIDASKRKKIMDLQAIFDLNDEEEWNKIKYSTNEMDFRNYITNFTIITIGKHIPIGKHIEEAKKEIEEIRKNHEQIEHEFAETVEKIKSNGLTPDIVQGYLKQGIIDDDTLKKKCNIPEDVIKRIKIYQPILGKGILGPTPTKIPSGFTEVYFWGIPNSGKTCALSTILNTAHKKGYMKTGEGEGLKYLHILKNLYKTEDNIGYLLENTPDRTQYLPFTLKKENEKYARSVSLIELSGEVFKCFCKKNIGEDLDDILDSTFTTLNNFLKNGNRKIHFFFIDYDPISIEQDDYTQSDYLEEASKYFERNNVFSESTDAIYVVITKSDLIDGYGTNEKQLNKNINKYIDDNFMAFDNYLTDLCKTEKINSGKRYDIIPFSIGDVYCKRICKINRKPAEIIINCLFDRIQPQRKTIFDY